MPRGLHWLIELASSEICAPLYVRESPVDGTLSWTRNHDDAHRFSSKPEGEAFAAEHLEGDVRVCEHGWA